eukprot:TRINITY_DN30848_c0_g1_i1.p1 TRINITY_DN30848_c0_g1~~TRINITY_DN30848_c0_g1_i1.p1  ORF type:complete len:804 (+),score=86.88 TRINITY_DN30848_c0_g1_i1:200-2413(+)
MANRTANWLERPLKSWHDPVSKRWFRYKFSYKVAKQLREKAPHEKHHRFSFQIDKAEICQWIFEQSTVWQVFLFIMGAMLLSHGQDNNPTKAYVVAGAVCLMLVAPVGLAGSWVYVKPTWCVCLRAFSLLLCAVATSCLAYSAHDNFERMSNCLINAGFNPLESGPDRSNPVYLQCPSKAGSGSVNCTLDVNGKGLADGDRLLAVPDGSPCLGAAETAYVSDAAAGFGRRYVFAQSVPPGVYTLCWCPSKSVCADKTDFKHFAGRMYFQEEAGKFDMCNLVTMVGFQESAYMCVVVLIFHVLALITGVPTLFKCVYNQYITDLGRRVERNLVEGKKNRASLRAARLLVSFRVEHGGNDKKRRKRMWHRIRLGIGCLSGALVVAIALAIVYGRSKANRLHTSSGQTVSALSPASAYKVPCPGCCNLQLDNCRKRVDEVSFATTHNSMSSSVQEWTFANNIHPLEASLNAGIRALMLDVHYNWLYNATSDEKRRPTPVHLCHGLCALGHSLLLDTFVVIKSFLDKHPREVIVLIFEQYVATDSIIRELETAGLIPFVTYAHPNASTPWPTLQALIDNGTRLIILSDKGRSYRGAVHPDNGAAQIPIQNLPADHAQKTNVGWWHYMWNYMVETPYQYSTLDKIKNDTSMNRGKVSLTDLSQKAPLGNQAHRLTIVNHFISNPMPCRQCAAAVNEEGLLKKRMTQCRDAWAHQVNFPTVDFWSIGSIVDVSLYLNTEYKKL